MKKRFGFKRGFCLVVLGAILMAVLPGVPGVGSGAVVLAQKGKGNKGKPPPEPVTRFEVRYETADDPRNPADPLSPFNLIPDGEGLFGEANLDCKPDDFFDCPYVDGQNDSTIYEQDGLFKQLQGRDQDLRLLYPDIEKPHYRHFETDIESKAMEGNLCTNLLDPTSDSDWTLGGGYSSGETVQKILFSLWVDVWPDAGQTDVGQTSFSTGWARLAGASPVDPRQFVDFDNDIDPEELLTRVSPHWELVWDEQEHDESMDLEITHLGAGTFRVASLGQAMLRVKRSNGGRYRNCDYVDARFEFVATPR